ncbi:MAG: tetratricopeptide repeat protein [bacterium]
METKPFDELVEAANQGHAGAQSRLGYLYENGRGVPLDNAIAAEWYHKAAEQGDLDAQTCLGYMYTEGRGVEPNECLAAEWCKKAAEKGFHFAQDLLGTLYEYGSGVDKDDSQAAEWYRKAAEQGNALAQRALGCMYEQGAGVTVDKKLAFEWYTKAAEQGDKLAMDKIGYKTLVEPQTHYHQALLFIRERRYLEVFKVLEFLDHEAEIKENSKNVGSSDPAEAIHVGVDEEWNQHYFKAIMLEREHKLAQALKEARTSALIALERLGPEHVDFAASLNMLGELYGSLDRKELSFAFIRRSLVIRFRNLGLWHSEVAECIFNIAWLDSKSRSVEATVSRLSCNALALRIRVKVFGKSHPAVALSLLRLGRAYRARYDFKPALKCVRKAISIYEETIGTDHLMTQRARRALEASLEIEERFNCVRREENIPPLNA